MRRNDLAANEIFNTQEESSHLTVKNNFSKLIPDQFNVSFEYSKMATYYSSGWFNMTIAVAPPSPTPTHLLQLSGQMGGVGVGYGRGES